MMEEHEAEWERIEGETVRSEEPKVRFILHAFHVGIEGGDMAAANTSLEVTLFGAHSGLCGRQCPFDQIQHSEQT